MIETQGRVTEPDPKRWNALVVLSIAYLMVVLDIAIVNVALPSIKTDLHFTSDENLQWIVSGYSLTFGGFLLLGGRAGDILGRRRVFMAGLLLFAATSLLAGLSTSSAMLIGARVAQGAAGAILSPSVFSITSVTFQQGSERNKALGVLGAISGAGAAIGVILGGVLTQYVGWEWIFFVNVPIGLITLLFVPRVVRESRAEGMEHHFDAIGAVLATGGLMLFVYALTRTNQVGWSSTETILEFIGSAALLVGFVLWEARTRYALVPLRIFRRRTLTGANIIGFLLGTMIFGRFFLLSLYMQEVLGFTAIKTGIGYLAVALTAIVSSAVAQALVTRTGVKPALLLGLALTGGGLLLFTQISPNGSYFTDLFPGFVILGIGLGFTFVPISIAALAGVTGRDAGLASGLINTSQQIGGALGLAILTTVSTHQVTKLLGEGKPQAEALTSGYSVAFWVAFGVAVAAIIATLLIVRKSDLEEAQVEAQPEAEAEAEVAVGEPA
jgi:EmrB/QacA subfamily drug resistance transporter